MNKRKVKKGFGFRPSTEYIKATMNIPARVKLEWLQEMKDFMYKALPKKDRKIWEKLRRGEI